MKNKLFTGVATALATPFIDEKINFKVFEEFIELQINSGINALVVCGTTGEASTMSQNEKIDLIKCAISVTNKRVPIIVGTGSNNTLSAIEMSKIENIVGIKEASGNISQITRIASLCGDNLLIYSGNDDQILPILSLGGQGVISVLSNINPSLTLDITNSFFAGNLADSLKYQLKALPIINALFEETNPIPVKEALNLLGFNFGEPRLPLIKCSDNLRNKLKALIK